MTREIMSDALFDLVISRDQDFATMKRLKDKKDHVFRLSDKERFATAKYDDKAISYIPKSLFKGEEKDD